MAFRFEKASCVVLGTFNTYILHPKFLAEQGIIEKGTEVQIQMNFEEPGLRFVIGEEEIVWVVAPNRLIVESKSPDVHCGESIANVLQTLKFTPVYAVGNNVEYKAELAEAALLAHPVRDFPKQESPNADEHVSQRTFHIGVKRPDGCVANSQISLHEEFIKLACNVHTDLRGTDDPNPLAVAAANRFFDDRLRSKLLATHFFGTQIEQHEQH